MIDEIKPNDIVIVVRPSSCCNTDASIGKVGKVIKIFHATTYCMKCGSVAIFNSALLNNGSIFPLRELKRIPPLDYDGEFELY